VPYVDPIPELKAQAARALSDALGTSDLASAGALLGCDRFRIAEIRAGRLERFSLMMLVRYLARVHMRVELSITRVPRPYAKDQHG